MGECKIGSTDFFLSAGRAKFSIHGSAAGNTGRNGITHYRNIVIIITIK
jgi:hypothetical protein